jgi:hypothetical protein
MEAIERVFEKRSWYYFLLRQTEPLFIYHLIRTSPIKPHGSLPHSPNMGWQWKKGPHVHTQHNSLRKDSTCAWGLLNSYKQTE